MNISRHFKKKKDAEDFKSRLTSPLDWEVVRCEQSKSWRVIWGGYAPFKAVE